MKRRQSVERSAEVAARGLFSKSGFASLDQRVSQESVALASKFSATDIRDVIQRGPVG